LGSFFAWTHELTRSTEEPDSSRTTYKKRCLNGLKHPDPSSPEACHKPSLGALSKYCSEECGTQHKKRQIEGWAKKGGKREKLWESVKGAERREGLVVCEADRHQDVKMDDAANAIRRNRKTKKESEVERLNAQLDAVVSQREEMKKQMEVVLWRERVTGLASERSERLDTCGWDQRLCLGDEEWSEFSSGVLESYEGKPPADDEAMRVDVPAGVDGEGEWWCAGKRKCDRHQG
jgi:COMPASS component SPP1